jgi:hypothetical protein
LHLRIAIPWIAAAGCALVPKRCDEGRISLEIIAVNHRKIVCAVLSVLYFNQAFGVRERNQIDVIIRGIRDNDKES